MRILCWLPALVVSLKQPLAFKVTGAISAEDISTIQQARVQAHADDGSDPVTFRRNFGLDHEEAAGHSVVFLHGVIDESAPMIRNKLSDLAFRIDKAAQWNVTQGLGSYVINDPNQKQEALRARCLEYISYTGGNQDDTSDSIGWHSDGATLLTMMIMLSAPSSFVGGDVYFMNEDGDENLHENYTLNLGDVLAWRGWTHHKTSPIVSGHREVMVVEWWIGEDCADSGVDRGADTVEGIKHAIKLDPTSSWLYLKLGNIICKRAPCETEAEAREAESAFRNAVSLAPRNAQRLRSLARFLGGFEEFDIFKKACLLDRPQSQWASAQCNMAALSNSFVRMALSSTPSGEQEEGEMQEEVDEATAYALFPYQVAQIAGGLAVAGGLWMVLQKLEKLDMA